MFGLAFSNSSLSSRNFLRSTASVVGGRPLTVIVTGPPGEAAGVFEHAAAEDSARAAMTSSRAARPSGNEFMRQHLPGVCELDHTNSRLDDARKLLHSEITGGQLRCGWRAVTVAVGENPVSAGRPGRWSRGRPARARTAARR